MFKRKAVSFVTGFLILFFIYHFPEFFSAFWIMAACKIGFLAVAFFIALAQGWKGLGAYGLSLKTKWENNLLMGLLLGLLFFTLSFFLSVQMGYEKITAIQSITTIAKQLPMILVMTAFPSIAEDILTRGYLYAHTGKFMKPFFWILLSSIIYVLNHIWRLNDGPAVLTYLFILGMVLAYAVWIAKSLWLAFGIHWGANIAFESTHSFIQTTSIVANDTSTWILAGTWSLLLVLLAIIGLTKNGTNIHFNQSS